MTDPWPVRVAVRSYRALSRLTSRSLGREWRSRMVGLFRELARASWQERGIAGLGWTWVRSVADLVVGSLGRRSGGAAFEPAYTYQPSGAQRQGWMGMDNVRQDLKYAFRNMRRSPGYALIIIVTLALGIGANTAIFSVINGVLLKPLPFEHGTRLVRVQQTIDGAGPVSNFSPLELRDIRERSETLDDVVEYHTMFFNLLERGEEPERVQVGVVSWNFFDVIGVQPMHGRTFTPDEDQIDAEPVLLLGYDYWQRRFGGDPDVVGRSVEMNNRQHLIVGVLPPVPTYPNLNDVWMPWYACPFRVQDNWHQNRQRRNLLSIGLMQGDISDERAEADLDRVVGGLRAEFADTYPAGSGVVGQVTPLKEELTAGARPTFLVLLAMSGLVLLIACANVANLTIVRMNQRSHETAIRQAVGAGRGRILHQAVVENVVLALVGGLAGLGIAYGSAGMLADFAQNLTPRFAEVGVDGWVAAFGVVVAVATGAGLGFLSGVNQGALGHILREGGGKGTASRSRKRFRSSLVVAQVALAVVLSVSAGLMIRSFSNLLDVDPGFESEGVLTMTIDLDWARYTSAADGREFYTALLQRVRGRPQVLAAGVASDFPMSGGNAQFQQGLSIEDDPVAADQQPPPVNVRFVSDGYFDALGIPLLRGRTFEMADEGESPRVAILSRAAADRHFPERDPLGRRVSINAGNNWATVVGVVGDVRQAGFESPVGEEVYFSYYQAGFARRLIVKAQGDPALLARPLTEDVYSVDPRQPVSFVQTMADAESARVASPRTTTVLLTLFAAIALLTAGAGILGVVAYTVGLRTREIGIRVALGATRGSVLGIVLRDALVLVGAGLVLGSGVAWALGGTMREFLFGVGAHDLTSYGGAALLVLLVGTAAAYLPATRVLRVDPMVAFRAE